LPRHSIQERELLAEEKESFAPPPGAEVTEWGCAFGILALAVTMGCALGAILQVTIQILTRITSLPHIVAVLALFPAWRAVRWYFRQARATRKRSAQDVEEGIVEMIEVWDAVAVQQLENNDEGPFYFLDIGQEKVLALAGQGLFSIPAYRDGAPWPRPSEDGPEPEWQAGFLNSHFILHRLPRSARVLRIDVMGEPIAISHSLPKWTVPTPEQQSVVVDGTLDALAEAMARVPN
jgi:hypothetical protein